MSDRKQNQAQIEKLIEMANELEKKELELSRESQLLEQQRAELDQRERSLATPAGKPAPLFQERTEELKPLKREPVFRENPLVAPQPVQPVPPPVRQPVQPPVRQPVQSIQPPVRQPVQPPVRQPVQHMQPPVRQPAAEPPRPKKAPPKALAAPSDTVSEIAEILKTIFWDYSNNVHQISTQMSTVTAAMMCAAVSCVLENRGFDAKDIFLEEMQKILEGGGLGDVYTRPAVVSRPMSKPKQAAVSHTIPVNQDLDDDDDEDEDDDYVAATDYSDADADADADTDDDAAVMPTRTEDGVLRIASVAAFLKLGEYGFRNDDKIIRVELPEGITQLPGSFFYGCRKLEEVWIPDSVQEIGPYAFYGCELLQTVNLSEYSSLREIGEYAFAMCSALQAFAVPPRVEVLGTSVFRFCFSLRKISFAKDSMMLRSIGSHLLQNCTALEKVRLPQSITVIPTSMFYGCLAIKKVVAKGVDTIEDYAFYGCESLRTLRIRSKRSIAPQAFEGCDPALEIEYLQN